MLTDLPDGQRLVKAQKKNVLMSWSLFIYNFLLDILFPYLSFEIWIHISYSQVE